MGDTPSPRSSNTALWAIVGLLAAILVVGAGGVAVMMSNQRAAERQRVEDAEKKAAEEKQRKNDEADLAAIHRINKYLADSESMLEGFAQRNPNHPVVKETRDQMATSKAKRDAILARHSTWTVNGPPK